MSRREAFLFFTLTVVGLFFILFTTYTIIYNRQIKTSLRKELLSQAFLIGENLKIAETKIPKEDILNWARSLAKDDLKVTITRKPISEITETVTKFPGDERKWLAIKIPLTLREFSGELEVARPLLFRGPPYFPYFLLFLLFSSIFGLFFFLLSKRPIREFLFSFSQNKEAWRKFIASPEEIGEIARLALEKEEKKEELIARLKEKEQSLSSLVSSLPDPCFILDEKKSFLFANQSFFKLCSVDESSLISRASLTFFLKNPQVEKFIDLVWQKGEVSDFELELNGEFYLAIGKVFTLENKGPRLACSLRKITEKKRWEKTKQDFITAVAHEIKTPLATIKGAVESLHPKVRGRNRQFLSLINAHTERLANIASDLTTLSQLESADKTFPFFQITDINLRLILKEVVNLFLPSRRKKRLKIKLNLPKEDLVIKGDEYLLTQAFSNLLDNAIKYTEKGKVEIQVVNGLDFVEIAFSDTGIGIPEEDLERIFERFYVVDKSRSRKTGGTGLGLSIVKHIITLHKGRIEVTSELGKGSTFKVFLPKTLQGQPFRFRK